jgi:hypothetical protein
VELNSSSLVFTEKVLYTFWEYDLHSELYWRFDNNEAKFFVMCSDVFHWGTADCEEITPNNIKEFWKAHGDLYAIDSEHAEIWTGDLFAARMRKMRPQGAAYPKDRALWPLFDACGPKRKVDLSNPKNHPEDRDD